MREWTDVDYAQAAIDMLPRTVEEIVEFLRAQKIKSQWNENLCPLEIWLTRWTDGSGQVTYDGVWVSGKSEPLPTPRHIRAYMDYVDGV